ncbi:MAG TPA: c(7)-type cytochrome triheme domain-containing protein [Nitrospirota bacterium]|nr:c(7)-type cytochrome triheme domain-containing protein [Nitrospirota bacterium]
MRRAFSACLVVALVLLPLFVQGKVGGGDVEYKPKGAGHVLFQHEYHVNLKGAKCNNCHYKPFSMSGGGSYKMDMKMLTKGDFCGLCHDGKKAFDLKSPRNCKRCHRE